MKNIILFIGTFLTLASCSSTSKTTAVTVASQDSAVSTATVAVRESAKQTEHTETRDTVVSIPFRSVSEEICTTDLQPAFTQSGERVERTHIASKDGLTAFVKTMPDGKIQYGCEADSLKLVITNLRTIIINKEYSYDSLNLLYWSDHSQYQREEIDKTTVVRSFFCSTWYIWVGLVVVAIIIATFKIIEEWRRNIPM